MAPSMTRRLYSIAADAIDCKKRNWFGINRHSPNSILYSATKMVAMYIPLLVELRKLAGEQTINYRSEGLSRFFAMIQKELDDGYFETIREHLRYLEFGEGVLISAGLGRGLESREHVLRKSKIFGLGWLRRLLAMRGPVYSFSVSPRDDAGCRALGELRDRGVNFAADALARSADHIEGFFTSLLSEIAFYVGCLNLHEALRGIGEQVCLPTPLPVGTLGEASVALYNPCLSLHAGRRSVGNDAKVEDRNPVIVTGVNEGGKSTFLRSIGVAQLMMRCGMFAPAQSFTSNIATSVHTHYRRREDRSMTSGKLDEELARMDAIADQLGSGSLMLFNESFAATNEREGSDIASQITRALVERGVKVYFVTHLYSFASSFAEYSSSHPLLLRAERQSDGTRSFRLIKGAPTRRSHGEDLYRKVFGADTDIPESGT